MRSAAQFIARLVIVLGMPLTGLNPAMAGAGEPNGSIATHMTMMPGMPMDMGSPHGTPSKGMPCGGMDCGCCIGGACAMPAIVQVVQDIGAARPSSETVHNIAFLIGITFPPDIRPPISRGLAA
jgi:hypothetical protein